MCKRLAAAIALALLEWGCSHVYAQAPPRMVFAHYLVVYPDYGPTVEGYEQDIREAQAAGIDGFALDVYIPLDPAVWKGSAGFQRNIRLMFQAAQELNSNFKLFFSVDFSKAADPAEEATSIRDLVTQYGHTPSYFTWNGKEVLSTFHGDTNPAEWWRSQVLKPLGDAGHPIFFIPFLKPPDNLPPTAAIASLEDRFGSVTDGEYFFGASYSPEERSGFNGAYGKYLQDRGKIYMASYAPLYWRSQVHNGQRQPFYVEGSGGEGAEQQWESIRASRAPWVELATWNDWIECTYLSPTPDPAEHFKRLPPDFYQCHAGFLELNRYFIQWFKDGNRPPSRPLVSPLRRLPPTRPARSLPERPAPAVELHDTAGQAGATSRGISPAFALRSIDIAIAALRDSGHRYIRLSGRNCTGQPAHHRLDGPERRELTARIAQFGRPAHRSGMARGDSEFRP